MTPMMLFLSTAAWASSLPIQACHDAVGALPDHMDAAKRRSVRIETTLGAGSGFFISPDGFILTAAHVVGSAQQVTVVLDDGSQLEGHVLRAQSHADLALIRIETTGTPCLTMAAEPAGAGHDVFLIGSPGGAALTQSVAKGVVSGWRDRDGVPVMQTDASVNRGNSGGVALDSDGQAQAVISYKLVGDGVEGLGFGIDVGHALEALQFTWADESALTVSDWQDPAFQVSSSQGHGQSNVTVTVGSRPQAPIGTKRVCKKAKAAEDDSAFGRMLTIHKPGHFKITKSEGEAYAYRLALALPVDLFASASQLTARGASSTVLDIALVDGTMIHIEGAKQLSVVTGFWPTLAIDLDMPREPLLAMAASPVDAIRWQVGSDGPRLAEKSGGDGKMFMYGAACLAVHEGWVAAE